MCSWEIKNIGQGSIKTGSTLQRAKPRASARRQEPLARCDPQRRRFADFTLGDKQRPIRKGSSSCLASSCARTAGHFLPVYVELSTPAVFRSFYWVSEEGKSEKREGKGKII